MQFVDAEAPASGHTGGGQQAAQSQTARRLWTSGQDHCSAMPPSQPTSFESAQTAHPSAFATAVFGMLDHASVRPRSHRTSRAGVRPGDAVSARRGPCREGARRSGAEAGVTSLRESQQPCSLLSRSSPCLPRPMQPDPAPRTSLSDFQVLSCAFDTTSTQEGCGGEWAYIGFWFKFCIILRLCH